MNEREHIEAEASRWLARIDRGLDDEGAAALELWKAASDEHCVTFLRLQVVWQRADGLVALRQPQEALHQPENLTPAAPQHRLRWVMAMAASLLLCAGMGLAYLKVHDADRGRFETAVGTQRSLNLADGTHIELNTNTLIHTSMSAGARTVKLDHGQAYFEVVHDAHRPFVVIAGSRRITDLGTKFSVFRDGDRVEVVVKEGQVRVDLITPGAADTPVVAERNTVVITHNTETLVMTEPQKDIDKDMLWRSGMLVFNQQSLADIAKEFNRYNIRQIEVVGQARNIRIGGSFRADDIDVFKQLLKDGFGLQVVDAGDKIIISN